MIIFLLSICDVFDRARHLKGCFTLSRDGVTELHDYGRTGTFSYAFGVEVVS